MLCNITPCCKEDTVSSTVRVVLSERLSILPPRNKVRKVRMSRSETRLIPICVSPAEYKSAKPKNTSPLVATAEKGV